MWRLEFIFAALAVSVLSTLLALLWLAIQRKSYKYVDRWKEPFHNERRSLGIRPSFEMKKGSGAAKIARDVPLIVLGVWVVVSAFLVWHGQATGFHPKQPQSFVPTDTSSP